MDTRKSSQKFIDPIKERMLSVRALNCCKSIGVENFFQLLEYAKSNDLYHIRNCGPKTILELQDAINRYGSNVQTNSDNQDEALSNYLPSSVESIFDDCVLNCEEDVQKHFLNVFPNAETLYTQCFLDYSSIFFALPNTVSIETVFKCWQLGYDILNKTSQIIPPNFISKVDSFESKLSNSLGLVNEHFIGAKVEFILSRLSEPLIEVLNNEFERIKGQLSTRARNILEREQITAKAIIQFCNELADYRNIRYCGKQTASDIIVAYSSFYEFLIKLANSSPEKCNRIIIRTKYKFLDDKEVKEIIHFYEECGHLPFFKLVYLYFIKSNDRQDVIYDRANGITKSVQALTDIASDFCLSKERVRQIVSHYSPSLILNDIMTLLDGRFYPFLNKDFIDPAEVYPIISNTEFAQPNEFSEDALVGILSLSKGLKSLILGEKTLIISTTTFDSFDFRASIKDMSNTLLSKTTEDITLPISIFINNYIINNSFSYQKIENIVVYIVKYMFEIDIEQDNNILLKRNAIDVEDEFCKILENIGTPLSFDELCLRLLDLHPAISYTPGTLRSFLFNSDRITAIGKTSTYTLKKWNISNLTIRGLIHQILEESDRPLSLDDIVDFLAIKGRNTNRNSVNSNILLDDKYHFVKFEGGLIGIESKKYATSYIQIDRSSVSRKSFDERIVDFLDYIDTNHHIPFASSDNEEASLNRWYNNVIKGVLDVTEEQKNRLETELSKREEYIMTSSEFSFIEKCKDLKYFVSSKYELPTNKTDALLYNWFSKTRKKSFKFTPKKEKAYKDLIQFLSDYGFYIED